MNVQERKEKRVIETKVNSLPIDYDINLFMLSFLGHDLLLCPAPLQTPQRLFFFLGVSSSSVCSICS